MSEVKKMYAGLHARIGWRLMLGTVASFAAVLMALPANAETVRRNPGGQIVIFALRVAQLRAAQEPVRFDGTCDSACTLYLSLPVEQLCVTPHASFGFHLPYGVGARQNAVAADYLVSKYPRWVREWMAACPTPSSGWTRRRRKSTSPYAKRPWRSSDFERRAPLITQARCVASYWSG